MNDTNTALSQWTASGLTPIYISATSFSVAGDQTPTLQVARRLQFTVTAGTVYGTILTSVFGTVTTVTMTMDAGQVLDAGLTVVNLSILTPLSPAVPGTYAKSGANADITSLTGVTSIAGAAAGLAVTNLASINGGQLAGLRNRLVNGAFGVNQRALATNADDTYSHDCWNVLTQTGTVALSTLTDVENGLPRMARMTQSQAAAQRMGYSQIISGRDCKDLRGKTVTFRLGRTRLSTTANVRHAVLEWTGAEDTVTSDVVLDWTSATYTAGNFFLAANLTVSGTVSQALTAATLADGSAVTVTLGSTFNNLIVFSWVEATAAQNVTLDYGRAQIEIGSVATVFEFLPLAQDFVLCQRHYRIGYVLYSDLVASLSTRYVLATWSPPMRAVPTVGARTDISAAVNVTSTSATTTTAEQLRIDIVPTASASTFLHASYPLAAEL